MSKLNDGPTKDSDNKNYAFSISTTEAFNNEVCYAD